MSELYTLDNHGRKPAERVERDGKLPAHKPLPVPDVTLEQAADFRELEKQLDAKAKHYASRVNSLDDNEVNYGLLETFARNVADRIRSILK